jgi:hypothetical protein
VVNKSKGFFIICAVNNWQVENKLLEL